MRHVKMLWVCMVVVFVLVFGSVAASGASAEKLPAWGTCEVFTGAPAKETPPVEPARGAHEGKYADSNCVEPVKKVYGHYTGEYEWAPFVEGERYTFEGGEGSIGPATFETTTGETIHCSDTEEAGLYQLALKGPKTVYEIDVIFEGCESEGKECASQFHSPGKITDENEWSEGEGLKGELVYLSGTHTGAPTVGLTLTSYNAGAPLFTVVCEGPLGTVEIGGAGGKRGEKAKGNAVIGVISPVDRMTSDYTQTFDQTAGVQEYVKAERGKDKTLQMLVGNESRWVQLGLACTWALPAERGRPPVEIKAAP